MSNGSKISPSFEPFLAEGAAGGKREAIVIYRSPSPGIPPPRGRLRQLQQRLDHVRERATAQQPVQARISEVYLQDSVRLSPLGKPDLFEKDDVFVRDQVLIVGKNAVIPDNTVI